jgi:hypothetical protein
MGSASVITTGMGRTVAAMELQIERREMTQTRQMMNLALGEVGRLCAMFAAQRGVLGHRFTTVLPAARGHIAATTTTVSVMMGGLGMTVHSTMHPTNVTGAARHVLDLQSSIAETALRRPRRMTMGSVSVILDLAGPTVAVRRGTIGGVIILAKAVLVPRTMSVPSA